MKLIDRVAQAIYDKKGSNILALDIHELTSVAETFVIAEGSVDRHVKAISEEVESAMKEEGLELLHLDGNQAYDWIVMDYGDFVVHIFTPELRERFRLEELWHKAELIDLKIEVGGING